LLVDDIGNNRGIAASVTFRCDVERKSGIFRELAEEELEEGINIFPCHWTCIDWVTVF
jgi:hypothetical protein